MECPHCHSQISTHSTHCKRCGGAIPLGQHLLEETGILEEERPDSGGLSRHAASGSGKSNSYRFARLGDRFLAFALDTAFLFGLFGVVDAWALLRWSKFDGAELQFTMAALAIAILLNSAILFVYGWLLEAACGATLGKILVGIRIVATAGRNPLTASAIRNLLRIVDGLGFYLVGTAVAACSDVRQRIGDIFAQTAVVEQSFGTGARIAAVVLWVATLAGAGWAVPRICAANQPAQSRYWNQVLVRVGTNGKSAYFRVAGFTVDVRGTTTP
jgi:uncharacterized RDD family membrane protein YckC